MPSNVIAMVQRASCHLDCITAGSAEVEVIRDTLVNQNLLNLLIECVAAPRIIGYCYISLYTTGLHTLV